MKCLKEKKEPLVSRLELTLWVVAVVGFMALYVVSVGCAAKKQVVLVSDPPTLSEAAKQYHRAVADVGEDDEWVEDEPVEVAQGWQYQVEKGDCLWSVARKELTSGFLWPALWKANRDEVDDPDLIYPGQTLQVPILDREAEALARSRAAFWPAYKVKK